ncbi:MAG: hypothetical protein J6B93_01090 [Clostridia bacterium]|nr:hypothetical protein [Clostridia bacterium]
MEATGVYPTALTASLYNITDDTLVAEISATDSEPALQRKGTAGLSVTNNNGTTQQRFGQFDNFLYQSVEYIPDEIDLDGDSSDGDIATLRKLLIGRESSETVVSDINADGNTDICDLVFAQRTLTYKWWERGGYIVVGGGYDSEAAAMRSSIVNSISTSPESDGTTYYISPNGSDWNSGTSPDKPWKNLKYDFMFWDHELQEGDVVLFERGGVYRQTETLNVDVSGIYFGAYGEGAKPVICGSAQDYATASWTSGGDNIWTLSGALTSSDTTADAGVVVFDNGQWAGRLRSSSADLKKNGDFYHDTENDILYLYCDGGNPTEVYGNIEIGVDRHIFGVFNNRDNITFDNLCFRYTGGHGITLYQNNDNIKITNCEFGWIGGSVQTGTTRYGNAIQFWDSCGDVTVENNWIYQVYDAGFTFQFTDHGAGNKGGRYENIKFLGNLVEYCTYSVELFSESTDAYVKNVEISDNVMRFAGYGWGNQRPSKEDDSHINGWSGNVDYDAAMVTDFVIKNNVFDCSTTQIINWRSSTPLTGVSVSSNTYFEKAYGNNLTMNYGIAGKTYADNQTALEEAVAAFDPSPTLVKWLQP